MLFGCLPISNIPVFAMGIAVLMFGVWMMWTDYKDEQHAKDIERVRRCETRRRAMYLVEQGRKSRAERMN